jgi:hypothetical protein
VILHHFTPIVNLPHRRIRIMKCRRDGERCVAVQFLIKLQPEFLYKIHALLAGTIRLDRKRDENLMIVAVLEGYSFK